MVALENTIDAIGQMAVDLEAEFGVKEPFEHLLELGWVEILFKTLKGIQEFGYPSVDLKALFGPLNVLLQGLDFGFELLGDLIQGVSRGGKLGLKKT